MTLLVTPQDAERIALAQAEGQIMLVLRNPMDTGADRYARRSHAAALFGAGCRAAGCRRPSNSRASTQGTAAPRSSCAASHQSLTQSRRSARQSGPRKRWSVDHEPDSRSGDSTIVGESRRSSATRASAAGGGRPPRSRSRRRPSDA